MAQDPDDSMMDMDDLLTKHWQPIFPPADKLIPLNPNSNPRDLRTNMQPYNKEALQKTDRYIDGWTKQADRVTRHPRQQMISDILSRWWFVFPQWPPIGFDYERELKEMGYREVVIADWHKEKEKDGEGLSKVWQLSNFPGMFRNSNNDLLDLRPKHSCPCYANLSRQPMENLIEFVICAYKNQIECLKNQNGPDGPGPSMGERVENNYLVQLQNELLKYQSRKNELLKSWSKEKQDRVNQSVRKL